MEYVYIGGLLVLNTLWLLLIIVGLPGTWLMVASAGALMWWQEPLELFSIWTLVATAALALVAEIAEFFSGVAGAKKAGGSRWGTWGSLIGAILGAIFGTFLIPVPILGSILGVCLGAFAGAALFELVGGRTLGRSLKSGQGAAVGRFVGILFKLGVGVTIWLVIAAAAFLE